jgi:hypothetical protein
MTQKPDEVFIIEGKNINTIPSHTLQLKQFGESIEDTIHSLLETNPSIIPGKQMSQVGSDPPKFFHLGKGYPIGIWNVDHLFVDQFGILTFIETKLIKNPEASRVVLGKLIDFASSALDNWYTDELQKQCYKYFQKDNKNLDTQLRQAFGVDLDIVEFWKRIEENLRIGKIRLIAVSDELRPEVRRMVEYLNCELRNARVYGLELKVFGSAGGSLILIPSLIGQTEASIARHNLENTKPPFSTEKLEEKISEIQDPLLNKRLKTVFKYAKENELFIPGSPWESNPSFSLKGRFNERIFTFYLSGKISIFLHEISDISSIQKRDILITQLKKLHLVDSSYDGIGHKDSPMLSQYLFKMKEPLFRAFTVAIGGFFNKPFNILP